MNKEHEKAIIIHYTDGGIGVIPGNDEPVEKIRGKEFFLLNEGGYATSLDENGVRMRFAIPENPNIAVLITEKLNSDGSFEEIIKEEYKTPNDTSLD